MAALLNSAQHTGFVKQESSLVLFSFYSFFNPLLPRKALGMVIFSHMRSLTSRPDSGEAMALATDAMSECSDRLKSSKPAEMKKIKMCWKYEEEAE